MACTSPDAKEQQNKGKYSAGLKKIIRGLCPGVSETKLKASIMLLQRCPFRDGAGTREGSLDSTNTSSLLVRTRGDSTPRFSGGVTRPGGFTESQPKGNINVNPIWRGEKGQESFSSLDSTSDNRIALPEGATGLISIIRYHRDKHKINNLIPQLQEQRE